jgi:hypothetical protein
VHGAIGALQRGAGFDLHSLHGSIP